MKKVLTQKKFSEYNHHEHCVFLSPTQLQQRRYACVSVSISLNPVKLTLFIRLLDRSTKAEELIFSPKCPLRRGSSLVLLAHWTSSVFCSRDTGPDSDAQAGWRNARQHSAIPPGIHIFKIGSLERVSTNGSFMQWETLHCDLPSSHEQYWKSLVSVPWKDLFYKYSKNASKIYCLCCLWNVCMKWNEKK